MNIEALSANQLRKAATIKDKIEELQSELSRILGYSATSNSTTSRVSKLGRRKMSAAGRARIAAAAKARWARAKAAGKKHL